MPSSSLAIALILSCALVGGYTSIFTSVNHGFIDVLRTCISPTYSHPSSSSFLTAASTEAKCVLELRYAAALPSYTGVGAIDSRIAILLEFFSQGLVKRPGTGVDWEALATVAYLSAQFGGAWALMVIEGMRRGNQKSVLQWTGSFGAVFQVATFTIIAPIYLTLDILLSPTHKETSMTQDTLAVPEVELRLLPASTTLAFVLPTVCLALPLLDVVSPMIRYLLIALWHPFPLYQTVFRYLLCAVCGGNGSSGGDSKKGVAKVTAQYKSALYTAYTFILFLSSSMHVLVISTALLSSYVPSIPTISLFEILVPDSITSPPTLALSAVLTPLSPLASRAIVVAFLRWDVFCACASFIFWSFYAVRRVNSVEQSLAGAVAYTLFWLIVGGPVAPSVMNIWERDLKVLERESRALTEREGKKRR
ncbi:hypothetical protein ACQRIU_006975 [Beauveria bassiana]